MDEEKLQMICGMAPADQPRLTTQVAGKLPFWVNRGGYRDPTFVEGRKWACIGRHKRIPSEKQRVFPIFRPPKNGFKYIFGNLGWSDMCRKVGDMSEKF